MPEECRDLDMNCQIELGFCGGMTKTECDGTKTGAFASRCPRHQSKNWATKPRRSQDRPSWWL